MVIGWAEIGLRIDGAFNLKDKRRVIRSLLDHARRDFRVSAAEVDDQELWNSSVVCFAFVSSYSGHVESVLQSVTDMIDSNPEIEIESQVRTIERH